MAKCPRISRLGQRVLTRLMQSHIWQQPADSVVGWLRRGAMASASRCLGEGYPPALILMPFKVLPQVLELRGSLNKSVCRQALKRSCLGIQQVLAGTKSSLVFTARRQGSYLPGAETPGWGTRCAAGPQLLRNPS